MSTVESTSHVAGAQRPSRRQPLPRSSAIAFAVLVLLFVVFAAGRWTGVLPYGSDNDEYPLVARALLDTGTPVIAGVEATKYPLGYPVLLALFEALRLPALTGIALNFLLVGATAIVVAKTVARLGSGFASAVAAAFVLVNVAVWGSTTSLMPDTLITFLSALLLYAVTRIERLRDVVVVSVLTFVATSVKSVGVLLGGAASFAVLVGQRSLRRWFLLPGAAGVLALAVHALIVRPYPEPVTGYGRVFFLVNPYDAAEGNASAAEVVARLWTRWHSVLGDWGKAVAGPQVPRTLAMTLTLVLLAAGVWGLGRRWGYGAGLMAIYGVGLALWPFASVRFGLPMLPLAALGVGRIAASAATLPRPQARVAAMVAICAVVTLHGVVGWQEATANAASETVTYTTLHQNTAEAAHWADHNIPRDELIASPAYRELTERMGGRRILPVSYTTDPEQLWAQTGGRGAEWFVNLTRLYPRRARVGRALVQAYPERFAEVFRNDDIAIFRIR